jgi:hypothetical protein
MLRAWGWRGIEVRRARRADLRMGSIVMCVYFCCVVGCEGRMRWAWIYTEIDVKLLSTFGSGA